MAEESSIQPSQTASTLLVKRPEGAPRGNTNHQAIDEVASQIVKVNYG